MTMPQDGIRDYTPADMIQGERRKSPRDPDENVTHLAKVADIAKRSFAEILIGRSGRIKHVTQAPEPVAMPQADGDSGLDSDPAQPPRTSRHTALTGMACDVRACYLPGPHRILGRLRNGDYLVALGQPGGPRKIEAIPAEDVVLTGGVE